MRDFLAWVLLISVVGMWLLVPWRQETVLRLFNASSDEELMRRFAENRRFLAGVGLVLVVDAVAIALSLIILF